MKKKYGYSIIELVMVLVILAVLGGIAMPKFVRFMKVKAIEAQEDEIINAMRTAVELQHAYYMGLGYNSWPMGDPLSLITPVPPHFIRGWEGFQVGDGTNWQSIQYPVYTGLPAWWIFCPHRTGDRWGFALNTYPYDRGRHWVYLCGTLGGWYGQPGQIFLIYWGGDCGHRPLP